MMEDTLIIDSLDYQNSYFLHCCFPTGPLRGYMKKMKKCLFDPFPLTFGDTFLFHHEQTF
jgi:hypothetical protein